MYIIYVQDVLGQQDGLHIFYVPSNMHYYIFLNNISVFHQIICMHIFFWSI